MLELQQKSNRTVLYVEDNPANLRLGAQILRRLPNIRLQSAHTGDIGLALARSDCPDLIILDINLPGMDGYEVLRRLQSYQETRKIPVIALSANAMPQDIERGLASGFDSYLTKPLKVAEFIKVLNKLLPDDSATKQ